MYSPRQSFSRIYMRQHLAESRAMRAVHRDQPFQCPQRLIRTPSRSRRLDRIDSHQAGGSAKQPGDVERNNQRAFQTASIRGEKERFAAISHVREGSDVLLALASLVFYNPHTASSMLPENCRQCKPLIGYSHVHITADALAAVYSASRQQKYYTVEISQPATQSLDLQIEPATE